MRACQIVAAAALLVAPATGLAALINGDGADQFVAGPSTSGPQDANGTSVGNLGGFTLKVGSVGSPADNTNRGRNAVYVFQLPSLGAIANPFTTASLSFGLGTIDSNTGVDADLYGLARRDAAPAVVVADYYFGNGADSTNASRLQTSIMTPTSTPNSIINTDATGSANLLAFLNTQYAGGVGAGEYVYLRLNVDGALNNVTRGYNVYTADAATSSDPTIAARAPVITYSAIPEPASWAPAVIGALGAVCRRRRAES